MIPEVGKKYRIFYGEGNRNNKVVHIRAIIDNDYFVFRQWFYSKRRWEYFIEHYCFFECNAEYIKEIK